MKKLLSIIALCLLVSCTIENRKNPDLPSFNLLLIDSTTIFNTSQIPKGAPFFLVYFSPDCESCQKETEDLIQHMHDLKNTKFYFATNDPFDRLQLFDEHYKINRYPNIVLGRDYDFFIPKHYKPGGTPYLLLYDKTKRLRAIYSGGAQADKIVEALNNLN